MSEKLSAREAAERIGKTERTVRRWIERGTLKAERDLTSHEFRIDPADLAPWLPAEPPPPIVVELAPELAPDAAAAAPGAPTWIERATAAETRIALARALIAKGVALEVVRVVLE